MTTVKKTRRGQAPLARAFFSASYMVTLGTAGPVRMAIGPGSVSMTPQRLFCNVRWPNFLLIADLRIGSFSMLNYGQCDAVNLPHLIETPEIHPGQTLEVIGTYTGFVPHEFSVPRAEREREAAMTNARVAGDEIDRLRDALKACRDASWTKDVRRIAADAIRPRFCYPYPSTKTTSEPFMVNIVIEGPIKLPAAP